MCDAWYACLAFGTHVLVPDGHMCCVRCVRRYTFMRSGMDKRVNCIQALYRSWKFSVLRCYTVFLKMKITWSFKTLRTVHWTLQYHIPDHWILHCKNAKFLHLMERSKHLCSLKTYDFVTIYESVRKSKYKSDAISSRTVCTLWMFRFSYSCELACSDRGKLYSICLLNLDIKVVWRYPDFVWFYVQSLLNNCLLRLRFGRFMVGFV